MNGWGLSEKNGNGLRGGGWYNGKRNYFIDTDRFLKGYRLRYPEYYSEEIADIKMKKIVKCI